jgi:hypothetical protein
MGLRLLGFLPLQPERPANPARKFGGVRQLECLRFGPFENFINCTGLGNGSVSGSSFTALLYF